MRRDWLSIRWVALGGGAVSHVGPLGFLAVSGVSRRSEPDEVV